MKRKNLLGMSQDEIAATVEAIGEKPFRGKQLYHQIYERHQLDFDLMTELSKSFRARLKEEFEVSVPEVARRSEAEDGTVKYLVPARGWPPRRVRLHPGNRPRHALHLLAGRMQCRLQVLHDGADGPDPQLESSGNPRPGDGDRDGKRPLRGSYSIVFMGMGEPLQNYKNVMKSFRILDRSLWG